MSSAELRGVQRRLPFEPFRITLSDGTAHDIRHPDLLWVGATQAYVGMVDEPGKILFRRAVRFELSQVTQVGPANSDS